MFSWLTSFITDHLITGGALALACLGLWARLSPIPFSRQIAAGLWIAAAGVGSYGQGFAAAKSQDRSDLLAGQIAQLQHDIDAANEIAGEATARQNAATKRADDNDEKVLDYEKRIALASSNDCVLSQPDLDSLRAIGAPTSEPPASTSRVWPASSAAKPHARVIGKGAKSALAEYRAALSRANSRLLNDKAFYDDVRSRFSAKVN